MVRGGALAGTLLIRANLAITAVPGLEVGAAVVLVVSDHVLVSGEEAIDDGISNVRDQACGQAADARDGPTRDDTHGAGLKRSGSASESPAGERDCLPASELVDY